MSVPSRRPGAPPPLTVAASLVGVEAAVFLMLAAVEAAAVRGERLLLGATTVAFFLMWAAALAWCGYQLLRLHSWARAPVVLAQLVQAMVGASFWGGETRPVAVATVLVALVVLAGVFHPASLAALDAGSD